MNILIKVLLSALVLFVVLYMAICAYLYFNQENILFRPKKLAKKFIFKFEHPHQELFFESKDKVKLNALLFPAEHSRGLIFYLHGNSGSLNGWGDIAEVYNAKGYDLFVFDYRGFGKSEGKISSEEQFLDDIRMLYQSMKSRYDESKIHIIGYSMGTGPATMLASENHPAQLILLSPYYSMPDMMGQRYPFVPKFILKYKLETYKYLDKVSVPVTIFHGKKDRSIYFGSSLKLKQHLKPGDGLFLLESQEHNGMDNNLEYQAVLDELLP